MKCFHLWLRKRTLRLLSTVTLLVFCLSLIAWVIKTDESDTEFRDEFNTKEVNANHNLRTKLMHEYCGKTGKYMDDSQEKHLDLSNFIVLEKYKLVYCPVPKVSCTVWKNLLAKLDGLFLGRPTNYSQTYTKFMFVREPFERLLSAYRDVFLGWWKRSADFWKSYRKRVREYLVSSGRLGINTSADNTTFEEFATYVVLKHRNGKDLQEHWRPMYDLCHPCYIQFDFIGHYETLMDDAQFILRKTNVDDKVQFPEWRPTDTNDLMQKYYSNLTLLRIAQLQSVYKDDLELFGYTFPGVLQPVVDKLGGT
ncbi:Carbohydrate sulfotransferase 11 [Desmophyllum pertusum]|uniref:Carbohydrate sulfotransferase n=1 Tax=Desmophyllum pertusum TaxID=174260 RepID=A0A9W9Z7Y8_9CNID|nr:Carbohydrate sulfotransferase 11 [Desmophyllum pertusum]